MTFSQADIDSLAAKLESLNEGERAALAAALGPDDEVEGFGANDFGLIRGLLDWKIDAAPISGGDLGSGRISGTDLGSGRISSGDLGSGR